MITLKSASKKLPAGKFKKGTPRLLITIGDANGIGPEIILKVFNDKKFIKEYDIKIAGSKYILDYYSNVYNLNEIESDKFVQVNVPQSFKVNVGEIDKAAGKHAGDAIKLAASMCMNKEADAMITMPISKESFNLGGYQYPGHTEMVTEISGSKKSAMILYSKKMIVALATTHIALDKVSKQIVKTKLVEKLIIVNNSLVADFKMQKPSIAVLGLNPHGGDGGLMGTEEKNIITPMIREMKEAGFNIDGPFPADGFFASKKYKEFDLVFAMYHDQGLIPFKMVAFEKGVNYTAGLNFIRTSPDHGTAFNIAGKCKADLQSSICAIKLADRLARNQMHD
ncbi:4-hydroxythreonine-4-phosphate dehydrogenase PdxA [soil metagenome]